MKILRKGLDRQVAIDSVKRVGEIVRSSKSNRLSKPLNAETKRLISKASNSLGGKKTIVIGNEKVREFDSKAKPIRKILGPELPLEFPTVLPKRSGVRSENVGGEKLVNHQWQYEQTIGDPIKRTTTVIQKLTDGKIIKKVYPGYQTSLFSSSPKILVKIRGRI